MFIQGAFEQPRLVRFIVAIDVGLAAKESLAPSPHELDQMIGYYYREYGRGRHGC